MNNIMESVFKKPMYAIKCSQIIGYNDISLITRWGLFKPDGKQIYDSDDRYLQWETWTLDLNTTNIEVGTQFFVKALVAGDDSTSNVLLQYEPNSATVYYKLNKKDQYHTSLEYIDAVVSPYSQIAPPGSPPVLQCKKIVAYNDANPITKWALNRPNGDRVYTSGNYDPLETCTINFADINIEPGTQVLLKALVVAGSDSTGFLILEYHPLSNVTAYFDLDGDIFKTITMYRATSNPRKSKK